MVFKPANRGKQTYIFIEKNGNKVKLPDLPYMRITNTSVRKHLCHKLLDNNVPDTQAIHITGNKKPQSVNNYRNMSNRQQQEVSSLLSTSSAEKHESVSEPQVASNSSVQPTLANDDSAFNKQVFTEPPMLVRNQNIPQNIHLSNSEKTASFHVDSNNVLRSIFQNAQIHGSVFNITVNLQPPAKRPRIENESKIKSKIEAETEGQNDSSAIYALFISVEKY